MRAVLQAWWILLVGCGDLGGLSNERLPIGRFRMMLSESGTSSLTGVDAHTPLYVALVWGREPDIDPFCVETVEESYRPELQAVIDAGCGQGYRWSPTSFATVVPVPADARDNNTWFWFPIDDVPTTYDSQPLEVATLIAFIDVDGDGRLGIRDRNAPLAGNDIILGASIAKNNLIVFRDTAYDPKLQCYGIGCMVSYCHPPVGFSSVFPVAEDNQNLCTVQDLWEPVLHLPITHAPALSALRCVRYGAIVEGAYFVDDEPDLGAGWACVDHGHLLVVDDDAQACRGLTHYVLDCEDDGSCGPVGDVPTPTWWPCGKGAP